MTITTYTDREIALRQQLAAATQLAQLNGEIGAELKAEKLALEAAIEASRKQEAAFWMNETGQLSATKGWAERQFPSQKLTPFFAAPVVAPDVKKYGDDRAREALEMAADVVMMYTPRTGHKSPNWIRSLAMRDAIRLLAKEIK